MIKQQFFLGLTLLTALPLFPTPAHSQIPYPVAPMPIPVCPGGSGNPYKPKPKPYDPTQDYFRNRRNEQRHNEQRHIDDPEAKQTNVSDYVWARDDAEVQRLCQNLARRWGNRYSGVKLANSWTNQAGKNDTLAT